jgi:hypothetical protein
MPLYTFMMETRGGTYISQVRASSPRKAVWKWAEDLNPKSIYGFGAKSKEQLITELHDDENDGEEFPIRVPQLENTWCYTLLIHGQLVLINIVKTEEETQKAKSKK